MAYIISDKFKKVDVSGRDFPLFEGSVKLTLRNVHNGKTEVYEKHNAPTNALVDIFGNNFGGLVNYDNFADLYRTWLGGVLVFGSSLDTTTPNNYGIPASTSNPVRAHAGQTPLTDQADDITRGNPDSTKTVLTAGTTKLAWEWVTSAGNGVIAGLGLTHTDVGSYGCGVNSTAQKSLNPFADIGCISRSSMYGNDSNFVLGINNNVAYTFYLESNTSVKVYKTPINQTKFKLQGGALLPITAYTQSITVTLQESYNREQSHGYYNNCYYHFDFANSKLILFGIPTDGGSTCYKDEIDLSDWQDQTATHTSITVTGAQLWKLKTRTGDWYGLGIPPTKAMILDNHLYLLAYNSSGAYWNPNLMFKVNLANTTDITQIDTSDFTAFNPIGNSRADERFAVLGGLIVHDSYIVNGDKTFGTAAKEIGAPTTTPCQNYAIPNSISSPVFRSYSSASAVNVISACKLYLATKWNLDAPVTKTAAQSMTVEYTLTEV